MVSAPSSAGPALRSYRPFILGLVLLLAGAHVVAADRGEPVLNPRIEELATYPPYAELSLIVSFRSSLNFCRRGMGTIRLKSEIFLFNSNRVSAKASRARRHSPSM